MNRLTTALISIVEAVVAVGVGLGIALAPLTLLWGFDYGLQVDWSVFWKIACNVWLVGHGVGVSFTLSAAAAKASGLSGASAPIDMTLPALGFAIVTAWLGGRAGYRFGDSRSRAAGVGIATALVAVLGLVVTLCAQTSWSHAQVWQGVVFPALWFGIPATVTAELARRRAGAERDEIGQRVAEFVQRVPDTWRIVAGFALRAGTSVATTVVAVAGVVVTVLLFGSYAQIITLYERSHAGIIGGISLTVGQLAYLPDFIGWAVSWIVGPGFAIGTGSSVSPIGTELGPIPGIPIFGALPSGSHAFGLVWVLVPVVTGFVVAALFRQRLSRGLGADDSLLLRVISGVSTGVVVGIVLGGAAWLSSGAFGPGRLADVGPNPWAVGAFAALEVAVPAVIALTIGNGLVMVSDARSRWAGRVDTTEDEDLPGDDVVPARGGLLDALAAAQHGHTTSVHRFVVEEPSARSAVSADDARGEEDEVSLPASADVKTGMEIDGGAHGDVESPDENVTEPIEDDLQDSAADESRSLAGRAGAIGKRLKDGVLSRTEGIRGRADELLERAADLRGRVTGADAIPPSSEMPERGAQPTEEAVEGAADGPDPARPSAPAEARPSTPGGSAGFPWNTEEFARRSDTDDHDVDDDDTPADDEADRPRR